MTQQIIDIGANANDGTGEPLRQAFQAVNDNFTQIWASGPVGSQVVISGNQVSTNVTNLELRLAGNGIGTITVESTVVPSIDSVYNLGAANRYFDSSYVRYYYGNGAFLSGINPGGQVTFSNNAPGSARSGDVWIQANTGVQYLYFNDDTSNQWAEMEAYVSYGTTINNGTDTGNIGFANTTMYSLDGLTIDNGDLSHGATASLSLPSNGSTNPMAVLNYYGNFSVTTGISPGNTSSWIFNNSGNLLAPGNISAAGAVIASNLSAIGNITADYFIGNGSQLTGIASSANVDFTAVASNIIPTGNSVYSLGNAAHQWNDLYLSNATIYMNNVPVSLTSANVLTVGGQPVLTNDSNTTVSTTGNVTANYFFGDGSQLTNLPGGGSSISDGNSSVIIDGVDGNAVITTNGGGGGVWVFDQQGVLNLPNAANIRTVGNTLTQINSVANGQVGINAYSNTGNSIASIFFDSGDKLARVSTYNEGIDVGYDWTFDDGGSLTLPNAPGNVYFGIQANQPVIIPLSDSIILNANRASADEDYINVSQNGIEIFSVNTININNSTTGFNNSDINLLSGDDIKLQGRNKVDDTEAEGGDINIWAGNGANSTATGNDTGGGGDILIEGGFGGLAQGAATSGGSGGFIELVAGDGGTSLDSVVGSGGSLTLSAGSAGAPSDPTLGGFGGGVQITAGTTTRVNENGGSIELNTGSSTGLGYGAAGYLSINIPSSNIGPGGSWIFGGTGTTLNVPADSEIFGANFGNFTVGCAGNTIVTSSDYGANVQNWVFGYTGLLTLPGEGIIQSLNDTVILRSVDVGSGNIYSARLGTNGGLYFETTDYPLGWLTLTNESGNAVINSPSGNIHITPAVGVANNYGKSLNLRGGDADQSAYYTGIGGAVNITGGLGSGNDGGGGGAGGNVNIYAGLSADPAGVAGNVNISAGSNDWTFDNNGTLTAPGAITTTGTVSGQILVASQSAANEGGEIQLALPSSGTTLTGNIIIDSYQNSIRFFESGNSRGLYVDTPNVSVSGQYAIGYRDVPQIALSGNVTANSITAGKHFYSTTAGNLQVTIPDNANVPFALGATLTIVMNAAGNVIVAQGTGVSLYMAGSSTTGNRTVGAYGLASVMKVATDTWVISGTGVY